MKRQWNGAFPPVDESFERSMDRAFEVIRKENCQAKKKIGVGFILVTALVLVSTTALAIKHSEDLSYVNLLPTVLLQKFPSSAQSCDLTKRKKS